jgi:lactose/L-arabinose transport system substrate-binding protein
MFAFNTADADFPLMILQSMGVSMFDEEGNVNLNNNEGIKKAAEIIQALRDAGIYTELPNWDEYCKANITGGCVGTIQGCWFIGTLTSAADLTGKYAIVNLPKVDGVEGATHFASNGGSSWAVAGNSQKKDLAIDFLSKTYGASVEFYDAILEKAGAIATFLPAGESEAYARPQEFFGGQQVYQDIVEFAGQIPTVIIGVYHYEARDALGVALQEIAAGADVQQALDKAQFDVEFAMGM